MWVEFVGSLIAPRAFSSGTPVFPVTKKTTFDLISSASIFIGFVVSPISIAFYSAEGHKGDYDVLLYGHCSLLI